VGFVAAVARVFNIADVHCKLLPLIQPFLRRKVIRVNDEANLLNALSDRLPRPIYDYVLRSAKIDQLFEVLLDRQLMRSLCRAGHQPTYAEVDEGLAHLLRKLSSQGMQSNEEDKLLVSI
jgi:phosphoinositide-3-kinase regulatory subunit 4